MTDAAALALIAAEVVIDRAVLPSSAPDAAEGRRGREPLPLIPTPKEAIGVPDKQKE
ncbi:MAG: hypothetical protein ACLS7Z_05510 [Christensenellales bacterium]